MREMPYIVAAYAVTWTILIGFTAYLVTRARRAERIARANAKGA